jgi:hypothetical protein
MNNEIFISVDIEADGPIPGPYSMLSFGAAAFSTSGLLLSTFSANLKTLDGAVQDPNTMEWWAKNQEAWEACRKNIQDPKIAMTNFVRWVKKQPGWTVFVGYPASFDFLFIYWYMMRFAGESPFSFSAIDIKTYAMAMLKKPYKESTKRNMPARWFGEKKHNHIALDDAIEQGQLFCNMFAENTKET